MASSPGSAVGWRLSGVLAGCVVSVLTGALFSLAVGGLTPAQYLLEQTTFLIIELPFLAVIAAVTNSMPLTLAVIMAAVGAVATVPLSMPGGLVTAVVFGKLALTGMLAGRPLFVGKPASLRFITVAIPGIILACGIGIPVLLRGVPTAELDLIRSDTLDVYRAFMTEDTAKNAVENAMGFFMAIFRVGAGLMILGAFLQSWLALLVAPWALRITDRVATRLQGVRTMVELPFVPPMARFSVPFHAIWVFLAAAGLWLTDYGPVSGPALNLLVVMCGLYAVQGLAVVVVHARRLHLGQLSKIIIWVVFLFTLTISGVFLVVVGIFDTWFHLRSRFTGDGREEGTER